MELKKKHLGSFIFIKSLGREVEVCEENKLILVQHNFKHLFVLAKPVKLEAPKKKKSTSKKKKDDSPKPVEPKSSEHRTGPNTDKS
jgi:hypothetical protein